MSKSALLALAVSLAAAALISAQTREEKVRADRKKVEAEGFWIYNDLAKGLEEAKKTGKPILAILRCIPCEECVKLDDDLVNQNPRMRPLLEQFVRVRIVSTNGLDLSLFQFDYDQSFAAFMLNADGAIYGRFGTRSHHSYWSDDVTIEGLAKALQGALDLHKQYPKNKAELAAKRGPTPEVASPEKYPSLKDKYKAKLDYQGKIVPSCIHCHQIGDAQRQVFRDRKEAIPDQVLFQYPHPKSLGLILDPKECATVLRVEKGSPAEQSGFAEGDVILRLEGQTLLSMADVQWVLHNASPKEARLKAHVKRGDKSLDLTFQLPKDWRRRDDISWRVTSWNLRRMATGGMLLENLPAEGRKKAGLPESGMALFVKHLGQYGPHAAAKNAGFKKDDIVIAFDQHSDLLRESDIFAYALGKHRSGAQVPVTVMRGDKKITLKLPMQN